MMYERILVPLDGSKRAETIMPHVQELAHCLGSTLLLLTVVDPPMNLVSPYDMVPSLSMEDIQHEMTGMEEYLQGWQERLAAEEIDSRVLVEYGAVVATIIEVAVREEADMIGMASHGRTGLSQVFYGSIAAGVLQRVDRPLLLIRS